MKIAAIHFFTALCCLLFITQTIYSQDKKSIKQTFKKITNQNLQINICDDDNNGFSVFNIDELEEYVLQTVGVQNTSFKEQVLISTLESNIFSVNFPSSNADVSLVCDISGSAYTDVAVNSDKKIFICNPSQLLTINNCTPTPYPYSFSGSNSLSFDNLDNVYLGFGNESYVLNFNIVANDLTNFRQWHDFEIGTAGGDFVLLDDKMYVSWKLSNDNYRLYEVTINTNREYISHVDLGQLPDETYGLASELGTLYGVTPNKLFKIELDNFSFTDIIQNPNPQDPWYGATGLHEAITFNLSTHLTLQEAEDNNNRLTGDWTNTIAGGQTIYVRIENSVTGDYDIVLLELNIYNYPNVNEPIDLLNCTDDFSVFDFNLVTTQMQVNATDTSIFTYYDKNPIINNNNPALPLVYQSTQGIKKIYVKIDNGNCSLVHTFRVINNKKPSLIPISNLQTPTLLEICSFDINGKGFFNLENIKDVVGVNDATLTTFFYITNFDAENDLNKISPIYYLENSIQEIYIRATDSFGCYNITNFFLNENCLINENPLLYITFPQFITPNNDGVNDYWNIKGGSEEVKRKSTVIIYNRYGKELFRFNPFSDLGWDGSYQGITQPETDYWYHFTTVSGIKKTGNFSLKR